jgi:hypothetical protein
MNMGFASASSALSMALEVLHCALVFLSGLARFERSEIPPLARLRILLARVQPVFA